MALDLTILPARITTDFPPQRFVAGALSRWHALSRDFNVDFRENFHQKTPPSPFFSQFPQRNFRPPILQDREPQDLDRETIPV